MKRVYIILTVFFLLHLFHLARCIHQDDDSWICQSNGWFQRHWTEDWNSFPFLKLVGSLMKALTLPWATIKLSFCFAFFLFASRSESNRGVRI